MSLDSESILAAFREFIDRIPDGCWVWKGQTNESGYGVVFSEGIAFGAHRLIYQTLRGTIEPGLHLDHRCRNPLCVNPDHMEPVTPEENMRRRIIEPRPLAEVCKRGHVFDGKRTRPEGGRYCKQCINLNRRELKRGLIYDEP